MYRAWLEHDDTLDFDDDVPEHIGWEPSESADAPTATTTTGPATTTSRTRSSGSPSAGTVGATDRVTPIALPRSSRLLGYAHFTQAHTSPCGCGAASRCEALMTRPRQDGPRALVHAV